AARDRPRVLRSDLVAAGGLGVLVATLPADRELVHRRGGGTLGRHRREPQRVPRRPRRAGPWRPVHDHRQRRPRRPARRRRVDADRLQDRDAAGETRDREPRRGPAPARRRDRPRRQFRRAERPAGGARVLAALRGRAGRRAVPGRRRRSGRADRPRHRRYRRPDRPLRRPGNAVPAGAGPAMGAALFRLPPSRTARRSRNRDRRRGRARGRIVTLIAEAAATQRRALNPVESVWVAASAGTGKTKVLTDRLLALMLGGTHPGRILCLTFTRAAAAEMANRINDRLAPWPTL